MNWQHLSAFVWLRWRLVRNQWGRGGKLNMVILSILAVMAVALVVPLFIGSFFVGQAVLPQMTPQQLMYIWGGLVVGFTFFWTLGLLTELQRTETLALSKFLHLPVSVQGAFLINYVSSLLRFSLLVFLPVMAGLALSMIVVLGWQHVSVLFALAAMFLMVSALTYQFQGWLASLLSNPRRRRSVMMMIMLGFVAICQIPNILNLSGFWSSAPSNHSSTDYIEELQQLKQDYESKKINAEQFQQRSQIANERYGAEVQRQLRESKRPLEAWKDRAEIAGLVLPIGWLPLGVRAAVEGRLAPLWMGTCGMALIGSASLWRAYQTTLRIYRGEYSGGSTASRVKPHEGTTAVSKTNGTRLIERRIPWVSEPVSVVALASFQSLVRAPESKMMLLSPLLMFVGFGSALLRGPRGMPEELRMLMAQGAMLMLMFGMAQMMFNQFGFDREGFRVFVLSAASRRDILLGKNLALVPLAFGMVATLLIVLAFAFPMRLDHFLALIPLALSTYLLFCLVANSQSIRAPMYIAAGTMKPSNPKFGVIFLQMLMLIVVLPLTQLPLLLPIGIEAALKWYGVMTPLPICLLLSVAECAGVIALYRAMLHRQGQDLQRCEQEILACVTNPTE